MESKLYLGLRQQFPKQVDGLKAIPGVMVVGVGVDANAI
jgi:hypothetical protein